MHDAKIFYLLPDVFKLFYTFSYFFQTSIDLTCGEKKMWLHHLFIYLYINPCKTKNFFTTYSKQNNTLLDGIRVCVQDARLDSVMDPVQSYLEVFSCQPWLWLRQCPHSVCHKVSCAKRKKRASMHSSNKTTNPFNRATSTSVSWEWSWPGNVSCTNNITSSQFTNNLNQNLCMPVCVSLYFRKRSSSCCFQHDRHGCQLKLAT